MIDEKIKNFIQENAKEYNINCNELKIYSLNDMLKMEDFNDKFVDKKGIFGVYFIINCGNDINVDNIKTIEEVYKEDKNKVEFQNMINNQYKVEDLKKKLNILSNIDKNLRKILYIGKAGGEKTSDLYNRLKLYMEYGNGKPKKHNGGRAIWQIEKDKRKDLYVCWIYLNGEKAYEDAGKLETTLLKAYNNILSSINDEELKKEPKKYKYPFANWRC